MINKDTKIYGSFSNNPGNNGCKFFNALFKSDGYNAIYKSFYSDDIKKSISAALILGFSGFAVSIPFKSEIIQYLDEVDESVQEIGACNTVINKDGILIGYNTDWSGVYKYLQSFDIEDITILGNGGFSKAVQFACKKLGISVKIITRTNWDTIKDVSNTIFNATPVDVVYENLIDGRPHTAEGKMIANLQAIEQYNLYENELS